MNRKKVFGIIGGFALIACAVSVIAKPELGYITGWNGAGSRNATLQWAITSGTSVGAANLVPGTDNTNSIGTASLRVKDFQGMTATFGGATAFSGALTATSALTTLSSATVTTQLLVGTGANISTFTATSAAFPASVAVTATTATISGLLAIPSNAAPRTNVTPTVAGQVIYNSADKEVCFSTGTTATTWVQIRSASTACTH